MHCFGYEWCLLEVHRTHSKWCPRVEQCGGPNYHHTHTHTHTYTHTHTHTPCLAFSWNCSGPYGPQALCSSCMKWSTGTTSALISTTTYPFQPHRKHTRSVLPGYLCHHHTAPGIGQGPRVRVSGVLVDTLQWMLLCYISGYCYVTTLSRG